MSPTWVMAVRTNEVVCLSAQHGDWHIVGTKSILLSPPSSLFLYQQEAAIMKYI